MDRRKFLGALLVLAAAFRSPISAAANAASKAKAPPRGKGLSFSQSDLLHQKLEGLGEFGPFRLFYTAPGTNSGQSHLVIADLAAKSAVRCVVPMKLSKCHAIVLPAGPAPSHAFLPELEGNHAVLVDLTLQKVAVEIEPSSKGHFFSGHACFSQDATSIFVPEFPEIENESPGSVIERLIPSLTVKRSLPTGFYRPHNLILGKDGQKLLVGHYGRSLKKGEPPSDGGAAILDLSSGKASPTAGVNNPYLAFCHLERDSEDNVFISTRSWAREVQLMSPVLFGSMAGEKWESLLPEEFKDRFRFNFSIRYSAQAGVLGVAHLEGKMVSLWDAAKAKLLGIVELNGQTPLGLEISPDGRHFLVNTTEGELLFIEGKSRKIVHRLSLVGVGFCPHISVAPLA